MDEGGEKGEEEERRHNCHTLVVEMGLVGDDGFLASCCFRDEKA